MIKHIILYGSLLLVMFWQSTPSILVAQEQLEVMDVDLSQYPKVVVDVAYTSLNSTVLQTIQIHEDGKPQSTNITSLPSIRVGILADIYLGLNADIAKKLADAIDQLDAQDWQWEKMQRNLFVPVGNDGREVGTQTKWTEQSWRSIRNGIAAYYNATDETFKPKATKTPLKDLMADALRNYDNGAADQNYLIVLTDGFDKTSTTEIAEIVALAQENAVQIYLVNYDLSAINAPYYILQDMAKNLQVDIFELKDNDLGPVWQQIAQHPRISQFTYVTEQAPPFSVSVRNKNVASAGKSIQDNIPAVQAKIIQPQAGALIRKKNRLIQLELDWGGYPARKLREVTYSIAGGSPVPVKQLRPNRKNILSFTVADIPEGQPLLDIMVREEINGFLSVVQTRLNTAFAPTPMPPATPMPTPTPTTWLDGIIPPIVTRIPDPVGNIVSTDRNFRQLAPLLFPVVALVALWLAVVAWRRANRSSQVESLPYIQPIDSTTRKTTEVPGELVPIAQLILIQGERFLPALISLYEGRTKFGRDPSWADEYLPNRFVSLQQFAISISDDYQTIANYSERNPTLIDNVRAIDGLEENPETGSKLKSGSIIQFGTFKYKYQLISQMSAPDYHTNGRMAARVGTPHV